MPLLDPLPNTMSSGQNAMGGIFRGLKEGLLAYRDVKQQSFDNKRTTALMRAQGLIENPETGEFEESPEHLREKRLKSFTDLFGKSVDARGKGYSSPLIDNMLKQSGSEISGQSADSSEFPQGDGLFVKDPNFRSSEDKKIASDDRAHSFKMENDLRGEYLTLPTTKDTQTVAGAFNKIKASAAVGNAAGDMSLIFSYMKILDPSSTVREGEYATAKNAAGIPEQVLNMYNKAKDGQFLSPNQRQQFLDQSGKIYNAQLDSQKMFEDRYSGLAKNKNLDPSNIVFNYKKYEGKKQLTPQEREALKQAIRGN